MQLTRFIQLKARRGIRLRDVLRGIRLGFGFCDERFFFGFLLDRLFFRFGIEARGGCPCAVRLGRRAGQTLHRFFILYSRPLCESLLHAGHIVHRCAGVAERQQHHGAERAAEQLIHAPAPKRRDFKITLANRRLKRALFLRRRRRCLIVASGRGSLELIERLHERRNLLEQEKMGAYHYTAITVSCQTKAGKGKRGLRRSLQGVKAALTRANSRHFPYIKKPPPEGRYAH